MFTHAIGDRAIRVALDAYANASKVNGTRDARHRVEHVELVSADDVPRFGTVGVMASMQPLHAYPNDDTLNVWARNVVGASPARLGLAKYCPRWRGCCLRQRLAACDPESLVGAYSLL
ncbi:MAG: amidohydrolase family protein [Acidobacteria bacterium]|nr:amidohydrolase family protein [Acidobacteriota bacterium]